VENLRSVGQVRRWPEDLDCPDLSPTMAFI